jgi:hypothetical protein
MKDRNYVLVIIDPIYKGMGGREENAAGDVAMLCNELERIAVQTKAAVFYAAHFSKGNQAGKEAIDRISGSGVWARDADSLVIMTKHKEDDCFTIETILRNLPEQSPFVVRWNFPLRKLTSSIDPALLKDSTGRPKAHNLNELLAAISYTTESNPISLKAWAELANVPRPSLIRYAADLRSKGLRRHHKRWLLSPPVHHTKRCPIPQILPLAKWGLQNPYPFFSLFIYSWTVWGVQCPYLKDIGHVNTPPLTPSVQNTLLNTYRTPPPV